MTEIPEKIDKEKIRKLCSAIYKTCEEVDASSLDLLMSLEITAASTFFQERCAIEAKKELWKFFMRTSELLDQLYSEKPTNQELKE